MRTTNYDKYPATSQQGELWMGWNNVTSQLNKTIARTANDTPFILVVECYQGVHQAELHAALAALNPWCSRSVPRQASLPSNSGIGGDWA